VTRGRRIGLGVAALVFATALAASASAKPKRKPVVQPQPPAASTPEPTPPAAAPAPSAPVPSAEAPVEKTPATATPVLAPPAGSERDMAADAHAAPAREGAWAHALLVLRASVEMGSRNFQYVDRLTPTLRSYNLFAAPMARIDGEVYPLSRSELPVLEGLGVTAAYDAAFGLSSSGSSSASGASVGTSWSRVEVGARERIPLGRAVLLGLHGGYGQIAYSFDGAPDATSEVPSVEYHFVRGGADARFVVGALALIVDGSYLGVLSSGAVGSYFPRATVGGVEARAGAAYALGAGFHLCFDASYTRFFYTLNPVPGDAYVAGGALDQMATASLGLGYVL
jgi:hypothetical protein